MFHCQPYCQECGYEGPNFMWLPHFGMSMGVLAQDVTSLELRVIWVPDDRSLYRAQGASEMEHCQAWEDYVTAVAACELRPGERQVPLAEFVKLAEGLDDGGRTELPCPRCRALLWRRDTGIS
jgi:hypothetical protein